MSKQVKRWYLGICSGLCLSVAAATMFVYAAYDVVLAEPRDARATPPPLEVQVQTRPAAVTVFHETLGASGTVQPSMPVMLTAKVVSRVLKVPFDLGALVRPGQLLVQLDQQLFDANLESARANFDHAHRQLARMQALMAKKFASEADLEKARTAEAAARDALIRAQIDLANTRISSPVAGVVLEREINPGEVTKLDQDLIQLGVLDPVMMVAQVAEDKVGAVYLGMPGEVETDAYPGVTFTGSVVKIDSRVNDATRTFGVYVKLSNHDLRLRKGITGYARLESRRMVLAVPSTAIVDSVGNGSTLFIVGRDNHVHLRRIRCGLSSDGMTEVFGGLQEGEQVVTVGQSRLHDDESVIVNGPAPWREANGKGAM